MTTKPGENPAHPVAGFPGLTVRQAYKIAALQGILSNRGFDDSMKQSPEHFAE